MSGKELRVLRVLRVLYVTRTPNKTNPLIEHLKHLKSIGVSVDVEENLSGINGAKASKIRGKTYKYVIVDEVIDNEL